MSETRVVQYLDFPNETKSRSDSEYHVTCTFMRRYQVVCLAERRCML